MLLKSFRPAARDAGRRAARLAASFGLFSVFSVGVAGAGPNAAGTLILHTCDARTCYSLSETPCDPDAAAFLCKANQLETCAGATVTVVDADTVACWVMAAFPDEALSSLKIASFGLQYDPSKLEILAGCGCGTTLTTTSNWPETGSGATVTWQFTQKASLVLLGSLVVRRLSAVPASLLLTTHPQGDPTFRDDAVPPFEDPAVGYSQVGFGTDGLLRCPPPTAVQAVTWGSIKSRQP